MSGIFNCCRAAIASMPLLAGGLSPVAAQDAADIQQIEALPGGLAGVLQNGNRNEAIIKQQAVASGVADMQNRAQITQSGDGNLAAIAQQGSTNAAEIAQHGSNNDGVIMQQNVGNNAELQQSGNGLALKIEQFGAGTPGSAPISVIQGN